MRLGSTMREAMMSMMASSDKELEARRRDFTRGPSEEKFRGRPGGTHLKAGLSKRLVAPVQLISNFWGNAKVTGTTSNNGTMTRWVAAYWAANEKEGDSSHQGRGADERLQDDAQHPRQLQRSAQTPESNLPSTYEDERLHTTGAHF